MNRDFDDLVTEAIYVCKDSEKASPAMLARTLAVDFKTGLKVFNELVDLKIIPEFEPDEFDEDGENLIGTIDKQKLKEFTAN